MLKISKMSGKLKGLQALNTSPLQNDFCQVRHNAKIGICEKCYSINMCKTFRQNAEVTWKKNGDILSSLIIPDKLLPFINQAFFRFSAHGELINETHLINLINICNRNSHCTFALWTKREALFNRVIQEHGKPKNLIAIYSVTEIDTIIENVPENFDKAFCVKSYNDININCGNRCMTCLKCYKLDDPTKIIIEKLK